MATKSNKRSFLSGEQSASKIRREFIEEPLAGAKLSILGTGLELFSFMSVLPDAFILSQQRELERLRKSGDSKDARVSNLESSIEQATMLRTTIQRGEARVSRALDSVGTGEHAFHGFISNGDLEPIAGLIVRLAGRETSKRALTTTTDKVGYFRIPLGSESREGKEWREQVGQVSFSERLKAFEQRVATSKVKSGADESAAKSTAVAQAEILQQNEVVYTDPSGVPTDEGSVYREYVLTNVKPRSDSGYAPSSVMDAEDEAKVAQVRKAPKKRASKK